MQSAARDIVTSEAPLTTDRGKVEVRELGQQLFQRLALELHLDLL